MVGYIYKLCISDGSLSECYVGSTINPKQRKWLHKSACTNENRNGHDLYVYKFIRENGGFENWTMHILEEFQNIDKTELRKMERKWIEQLKPALNKYLPARSHEEIVKTEEYKNYQKEYRKNWNKENEKQNKKKSKEYYQKTREERLQACKSYYINKASIKIPCDICNKMLTRKHMPKHVILQHH